MENVDIFNQKFHLIKNPILLLNGFDGKMLTSSHIFHIKLVQVT